MVDMRPGDLRDFGAAAEEAGGGGTYDRVLLDAPCSGACARACLPLAVLCLRLRAAAGKLLLSWPWRGHARRPLRTNLLHAHAGTGVLAKRADLRWRRSPEDIPRLAALQDALLDAAAPLVAPGGLLVYSTCSIEAEEGIERVRAFLGREAGQGFALEPAPEGLLPPGVVTSDGCLSTLPHVHGVDGAFAARMRRRA